MPFVPGLVRDGDPAALADLLGDWAASPGPRYASLAAAVRDAIAAGTLARGDRLPAERRLAEVLSLSRSTVVAAYDLLREQSLVTSRQGSGTVVESGVAVRRPDGRVDGGGATGLLQRMVDRPTDVISLNHAIDAGAPALAEELAALVTAELPGLLADAGYHPGGLEALRVAVADHYTGRQLPTSPEQILVTNGATQAVGLIAQLYLRRKAPVVTEAPSWPGCLDLMRPQGATLIGLPMDDEGIRPDLLHAALSDHRPALTFVMPTFHNPTGTLMSVARRRQVAEISSRFGVPLVEDIAYLDHDTPAPVAAHAADRHQEILTVSGLSKSVWGGLRIGWVRGPVDVVQRLARLKALADMGSAVIDQALAARLLPRAAELSVEREELRRTRMATADALLSEQLPEWRWRIPDGGPALWIELPDADARSFSATALRHGVEVVPGDSTDPSGAHDSYLRLPVTFSPDVLAEVVARLRRAWEAFSARA